jgi:hypothetical protein
VKRVVLPLLFVGAAIACSSPDEGATVKADVPTRERFELVSDAMVYRCGTLDCHGNTFRNMRLYGYGGLRITPGVKPDQNNGIRVPAETDANYEAIVGLEPESLAVVIAEGGREPERLTLVAKARGLQNHKGGPAMKPGEHIDDCITSWLRGNVADDRCRKATAFDLK